MCLCRGGHVSHAPLFPFVLFYSGLSAYFLEKKRERLWS